MARAKKTIKVQKRDGRIVDFSKDKIFMALQAAFLSTGNNVEDKYLEKLISKITKTINSQVKEKSLANVTVEMIQDIVEDYLLKEKANDVAKAYIRYRAKRTQIRDANNDLMKLYNDIYFKSAEDLEAKRDNANINGNASMGIMLKIGAEGNKHFILNHFLKEEYANAHKEGYIHFHDLDFSLITLNCLIPNTEIIIKHNDQINITDFNYFNKYFKNEYNTEIINFANNEYQTLSFNKQFVNITSIMRRKVKENLYKINFSNGCEIIATADHQMTLKDGHTISIKDIKLNDEVPISVYPNIYQPIITINLIDLIKSPDEIVISNWASLKKSLTSIIQVQIDNILAEKCADINQITLTDYRTIRHLAQLNEEQIILCNKKQANSNADKKLQCDSINAILPIEQNLGKFIGYILASGDISYEQGQVIFSNDQSQLLNNFMNITKQLFANVISDIQITADNTKITIHSYILSELFNDLFVYKQKNKLFDQFKYFNNSFINGFLSALVDTNGQISNNQVNIIASSYELACELTKILALRNIYTVINTVHKNKTSLIFDNNANYGIYTISFSYTAAKDLLAASYTARIYDSKIHKFNMNNDINKYIKVAHIDMIPYEGYVYDFETEDHHFSANGIISHNCLQLNLEKLFKGGFSTGHGFLREPNSIRSYAALACIAIQSSQNDGFGGQSINLFDFYMAPGVWKSFLKAFKHNLQIAKITILKNVDILDNFIDTISWQNRDNLPKYNNKSSLDTVVNNFIKNNDNDLISPKAIISAFEFAFNQANLDVEEETHQAMEACVHNFNTLQSRAGSQTPFSSVNLGCDISEEGRLVTKELLNAVYTGLGRHETSIFPIVVFQIKTGVNYNSQDPNYDLFKQAMKCSAKRLFPTFMNEDAPYNAQYYEPGNIQTLCATMGCRTRVMGNVNGPEESGSRGNFAFTTINLPMIAIEAEKNVAKFFKLFDKYIQLAHDYLLDRFKIICQKHVYNFPFMLGQYTYMNSDHLKNDDTIFDAIKNASLSIGFVGLAECLVALIGKHHGESEEAQRLGYIIVSHLRAMTDQYIKQEHLNWSTFSSPAESAAGRLCRLARKKYGIIPGVTDKDYYTNSMHVPVAYKISAADKIRIEAPYHALCNAGVISYIEFDGDATKNLSAFETVIRAMHDAEMNYFAINTKSTDYCPNCCEASFIDKVCPVCGYHEHADNQHYEVEFNFN